MYRREENEGAANVGVINSDLNGDFSESGAEQDDDECQCERDEDGVLEMGWSVFWKKLSAFLVNLFGDDSRSLLHWLFLNLDVASLPDKIHELTLDVLGALNEVVWVIVPDDKKRLGSDEGSELMLSCS